MPGRSSPSRPWDRSGHRYQRAPRDQHCDAEQSPVRQLPFQFRQLSVPVTATRGDYPLAWQETTGGSQALLHATPEELKSVDEQIMAILERYQDRNTDPARRPADSLPVEILLFAYPVRIPAK